MTTLATRFEAYCVEEEEEVVSGLEVRADAEPSL
jgi:hypothetical protein